MEEDVSLHLFDVVHGLLGGSEGHSDGFGWDFGFDLWDYDLDKLYRVFGEHICIDKFIPAGFVLLPLVFWVFWAPLGSSVFLLDLLSIAALFLGKGNTLVVSGSFTMTLNV